MQHRHLLEHVLVPACVQADERCDALDAVGESTALCIDEARGETVPRVVIGQLGRRQPDAHPVGQPAVELDEARPHPLGPFEPSLLSVRVDGASRRGAHTGDVRFDRHLVVARSDRVGRVGRIGRVAGRRMPISPLHPLLHERQTFRRHHALRGEQQQQAEAVLARHLAAGARAPERRATQIDGHLVRFGRRGDVLAPHGVLVAPGSRPRRRLGRRDGRSRRTSIGRQQHHLFGGGSYAHRPQGTQRVRHR